MCASSSDGNPTWRGCFFSCVSLTVSASSRISRLRESESTSGNLKVHCMEDYGQSFLRIKVAISQVSSLLSQFFFSGKNSVAPTFTFTDGVVSPVVLWQSKTFLISRVFVGPKCCCVQLNTLSASNFSFCHFF